ncbi:hypothetical protein ABZ799_01425 [Nocardiopsis dassonvillei]|uniref:hypothetical protein n=1 Tax=Nocardiopsis dassonvillei TaxID=2014 RepID=UPI0033CF6659
MSDTELLREAARRIRETANAATANACPDWTWLAVRHIARNCDLECPTHGDDYEACGRWDRYDDSPHISLWHPGVALAVADWLESEADLWGPSVEGANDHAHRVARALSAKEA